MASLRRVSVKCLFCGSPLRKEEGGEYGHGDQVKCHNCGEMNDYTSALEMTKEQVREQLAEEMKATIRDRLKGVKGIRLK